MAGSSRPLAVLRGQEFHDTGRACRLVLASVTELCVRSSGLRSEMVERRGQLSSSPGKRDRRRSTTSWRPRGGGWWAWLGRCLIAKTWPGQAELPGLAPSEPIMLTCLRKMPPALGRGRLFGVVANCYMLQDASFFQRRTVTDDDIWHGGRFMWFEPKRKGSGGEAGDVMGERDVCPRVRPVSQITSSTNMWWR